MINKSMWINLIGVITDFSVGDRIRHVHTNRWHDVLEILDGALRLALVHPTVEQEEILPHHFFISPKRTNWQKVDDVMKIKSTVNVMKLRPAALIAVFGEPSTDRYYHFRNGYGEYLIIDSRNDDNDDEFWEDTEYHDFSVYPENISLSSISRDWIHRETEGPIE